MVEFSCVLSAILFTAGNVLMVLYIAYEHTNNQGSKESTDKFHELDPTNIQERWEKRLDTRFLWLASSFTNSLAWIVFTIPILKLSWILSHKGSKSVWIHVAIAMLVFTSSFTQWLSHFFWIGSFAASKALLDVDFNLDNWLRVDLQTDLGVGTNSGNSNLSGDGLGWKTLEVDHFIITGFVWFVDAFEWLCLAFMLILIHISIRYWRVEDATSFGGCWNGLGLFIALLSIAEFVTEILRFEGLSSVFGMIALLYAAINRLILIPYWICGLGYGLDRATAKQIYGGSDLNAIGGELALTEVRNDNNNNVAGDTNPFTIGDDDDDNNPGANVATTPTASGGVPAGLKPSPPPAAFGK